jgi:transcriptional regulator with XRE-family HTH domain
MTTAAPPRRPVGALVRDWRVRRRMTQIDLALEAGISTRHLSFVETGRSAPSREMVLLLAKRLDLPLRERNQLLLSAGYAPVYSESPLNGPQLAAVRAAVRQVLRGHEPYPAMVVDRSWNLVDANAGVALLTNGVARHLLTPPVNVLRVGLHPEGLAPRVINLGEWRAHLLGRLRRRVARASDPDLARLLRELQVYPCDQPEPAVELPGPGGVFVPLRLRHGDRELTFFSTLATFGTPLDVTVAELAIESFFPADPDTSAFIGNAPTPATNSSTEAGVVLP